MNKWYKKQIHKMVSKIEDELFLKRIYVIIKRHIEKED